MKKTRCPYSRFSFPRRVRRLEADKVLLIRASPGRLRVEAYWVQLLRSPVPALGHHVRQTFAQARHRVRLADE